MGNRRRKKSLFEQLWLMAKDCGEIVKQDWHDGDAGLPQKL